LCLSGFVFNTFSSLKPRTHSCKCFSNIYLSGRGFFRVLVALCLKNIESYWLSGLARYRQVGMFHSRAKYN
jgi:hypothetical protein